MDAHTNSGLASGNLGQTSARNWYALYTCPRHEKKVAEQIEQRQISCFLPLYRSTRRWRDRRKELELALFPGYVFVRIAVDDKLKVLQVPGAVRLVSSNGKPCALPEQEIECLRNRQFGCGTLNRTHICASAGALASAAVHCKDSKASSGAARTGAV